MNDITIWLTAAAATFTLFLFGFILGQFRRNRLNISFLAYSGNTFIIFAGALFFRIAIWDWTASFHCRFITASFFFSGIPFLYFLHALTRRNLGPAFYTLSAFSIGAVIVAAFGPSTVTITSPASSLMKIQPNLNYIVLIMLSTIPSGIYGSGLMLFCWLKEKNTAKKANLLIWNVVSISALLIVLFSIFEFPFLFGGSIQTSYTAIATVLINLYAFMAVRKHNLHTINASYFIDIMTKILFETSEALLILDNNGSIVKYNSAALMLFAKSPEKMTKLRLCEYVNGYDYKAAHYHTETTILRGEKHVNISITNFHVTNEDETMQTLVYIRDISAIKRALEEKQRSQQLESLGLLAGGIAHDFNNYLTGIISSFILVKMDINPESEAAVALYQGEKSALHARKLIKKLSTLAKGDMRQLEVFELRKLLTETANFHIYGSTSTIDFNLPEEEIYIFADLGQMRQVFSNIFLNASQAMPDGGIIRTQAVIKKENENEIVSINISDSGCGIAPDVLPRVFDPYFTTKEGGTGLGLCTAYSIIKNHNGKIAVSSGQNAGAKFTVTLPLYKGKIPEPAPQSTPRHNINGSKVLIMDDLQIVRRTLSMILKKLGYTVEESCNANEAAAMFSKAAASNQPYSFIISDLTVPGSAGGRKLAEVIRAADSNIPIIVSSGYCDEVELSRYWEFGFSAVLKKPYNAEELRSVIDSLPQK
ncbi:MAG: response regulator [Chitinispirillales bacterium]|jgi:signal transduction histidine kinase/CheY-like chemotaxis protein|nr:response regulator [Chitinispirillales bacterium]